MAYFILALFLYLSAGELALAARKIRLYRDETENKGGLREIFHALA